jgi:hypothetical protein
MKTISTIMLGILVVGSLLAFGGCAKKEDPAAGASSATTKTTGTTGEAGK